MLKGLLSPFTRKLYVYACPSRANGAIYAQERGASSSKYMAKCRPSQVVGKFAQVEDRDGQGAVLWNIGVYFVPRFVGRREVNVLRGRFFFRRRPGQKLVAGRE